MQQTITPEKIHRYRCPGCGADLLFEPKDGCLTCPYCGRQERIGAAVGVEERGFEEYLRLREGQLGTLAEGALEVRCESCAATVTFVPPQVAGECDFCGSKIVAQPVSANPLVAPEGVLPFSVAPEQAANGVRRWINSLWFAPNALKRLASHDPVSGVYVPFWTFDAYTVTHYTGQRGEHYHEAETYTVRDSQGRSETKTRQVRKTRWYPTSGTVARWFDDLLVPATKSLQPQRLAQLEPWDLGELRRYEPSYLSGFKAQRYQVDLPEGFESAKKTAEVFIRHDVCRDIGGDEQRIDSLSTQYSAITFKHLLLPVYVGAYRFGGKIYQVAVNGRTCEVQGERPYSFWKIFFFVLFLLLVVIFAVLLLGSGE